MPCSFRSTRSCNHPVPSGSFADLSFDAMHWIVVPHRLPPFHDQGDLLRITGILSIVSARCPFCWSSHPSLYIPILFLNVLRSLLVRIIDTPRGFTELRIPSLFSH